MKNKHADRAWTTNDEINTIIYMSSNKGRSVKLSIEQRRARVEAWIRTSSKRRWPRKIVVGYCRKYAESVLVGMRNG